jgi:quercetin dioxygenase-like cupin family protein
MRTRAVALLLGLVAVPSIARGDESYRPGTHVTRLLQTTTTSADQPLTYPSAAPEVSMLEVVIDAGAETGWHQHAVHGYAYILSGTLELETEGRPKRRFTAGQAFAEVIGLRHNGRALGKEPVRLVVVFTGTLGVPFTTRAQAPARRAPNP